MKANEFFKAMGLRAVKQFLENDNIRTKEMSDELKRLVESHELVEIHGYEKSKEIVTNAPSDDHFYSWTLGGSGVRDKTVNIGELRKAIADVESCMERQL